MNNKIKNGVKNIIWGFGGQLLILALGIVVPRLIIVNYGSEINGLTSTVTQIYTYVALLEAGVGQSALFALYKSKTNDETSTILRTAVFEYRKTGYVFLACIVGLSFVFPLIVKSELPYLSIALIVFSLGFPSWLSYYVVAAYLQLLTVEGKHYIETGANLIATSISYIVKIVLALLSVNVVALCISSSVVSLLKTVFLIVYIKKRYKWVGKKGPKNPSIMADRVGYIKTQIAWVVFSNTDVLFISLLKGLKESSVYAVYNMIYTALYSLMNQIYAGVSFMLGHEFNKSKEAYILIHDSFDAFFDMLVCSTMTISCILTYPFIRLYTAGVTDINYLDSWLPILFCLVQILTWIRFASGNLTSLAGYAKKIGNISIIEAVINIGSTIIFVLLWGLRGALLGTIVALLFKSNYLIVFANKKILNRGILKSYRICLSNIFLFLVVVIVSRFVNIQCDNYGQFVLLAFILSAVVCLVFLFFNLLVNSKETRFYLHIIVDLIKKKCAKQ